MAIQTINIGTIANDGTGDDLREAFVKVNNNFSELNNKSPEQTTAANLGSAGQGIFAQLSGTELQFKKIVAGSAITLASDANTVTINSTATGLPSIQVFADNNNVTIDSGNNNLTLAGGNLVTTNLSGNTITIAAETSLITDTNPRLSQNLDGNGNKIYGTSDVESNVWGIDIREMDGIQEFINELNLGEAFPTSFTNTLQYLARNLTIDFDDGTGTFTESNEIGVDMGTLPIA